ncbi:hypothetical protein ACVWZN_001206 [Lysobacter sp. HA35]
MRVIVDGRIECWQRDATDAPTACDVETGAVEHHVGIDVFGGGPVRLELHRRGDYAAARFEAAFVMTERPVVEIADHHRATLFDATANQRGIEPLHDLRRHHVAHPEALGDGHLRGADVGRDVDEGTRAVALPQQAAAHVGRVALTGDVQRTRADAPAGAVAPDCGAADEMHHVIRPERLRPHEADRAGRIEVELHAVDVAAEVTADALQPGRGAGALETDGCERRIDVGAAARAVHVHVIDKPGRRRRTDPTTRRFRETIGQGRGLKQRRDVDAACSELEATTTRKRESIKHLARRPLLHAQGRQRHVPLA